MRREEVILGDSVRWLSMYLIVITSGLSVPRQPGSPWLLPRWPAWRCNISHQVILNASHKLFDEGSSSPRSIETAVFLLLLLSYLGISSHPDTLSILALVNQSCILMSRDKNAALNLGSHTRPLKSLGKYHTPSFVWESGLGKSPGHLR